MWACVAQIPLGGARSQLRMLCRLDGHLRVGGFGMALVHARWGEEWSTGTGGWCGGRLRCYADEAPGGAAFPSIALAVAARCG